jgi:Ribbon-helix-helix protein, copG family
MKLTNPTRVTVAFDQSTAKLLEKLSQEAELSQSEIMRRAIKFYNENQELTDPTIKKKIGTYIDMLISGEHVILDIDHWLLFLRLIESSPDKENFWTQHKEVAKSHGTQLKGKVHTPEELLERLETCNFYRLTKNSETDFTLIFGSELAVKFIKIFLTEFFAAMDFKAEIKENLSKLNVSIRR